MRALDGQHGPGLSKDVECCALRKIKAAQHLGLVALHVRESRCKRPSHVTQDGGRSATARRRCAPASALAEPAPWRHALRPRGSAARRQHAALRAGKTGMQLVVVVPDQRMALWRRPLRGHRMPSAAALKPALSHLVAAPSLPGNLTVQPSTQKRSLRQRGAPAVLQVSPSAAMHGQRLKGKLTALDIGERDKEVVVILKPIAHLPTRLRGDLQLARLRLLGRSDDSRDEGQRPVTLKRKPASLTAHSTAALRAYERFWSSRERGVLGPPSQAPLCPCTGAARPVRAVFSLC